MTLPIEKDDDVFKFTESEGTLHGYESKEIVRINADGRVFWRGREVETDDDFRSAMMDMAMHFRNGYPSTSH